MRFWKKIIVGFKNLLLVLSLIKDSFILLKFFKNDILNFVMYHLIK